MSRIERPWKECPKCKIAHQKKSKFCGNVCWFSSDEIRRPKPAGHGAAVSRGNKGKPKPWNRGENNPNWGNKAQGKPEARKRFLAGIAKRGPTGTAETHRAHSERMLGPANKMRGRKHTDELKRHWSEVRRKQFADGVVKVGGHKISKAEKTIGTWLANNGYVFLPQFHIPGVRCNYDFYLPDLNLILEFNGDYWHANPNKYYAGTMLTFVYGGALPVEAIWARDAARQSAAESHGYRFAVVWESEFKRDGIEAVLRVLRIFASQAREQA